ncbi:MAG: hypothetical protein ABIH41_03540 [Nanoarchaeota archaeon]
MTKRGERGQAALEFLTTYGWAFMIILVSIAALAYFGLRPPVPTRCIVSPEFSCTDYQMRVASSGANLSVLLRNSAGEVLDISEANCTFPDLVNRQGKLYMTVDCPGCNTSKSWQPGEARVLECVAPNAAGLSPGDPGKVRFSMSYQKASIANSFTHTVDGEVVATVIS